MALTRSLPFAAASSHHRGCGGAEGSRPDRFRRATPPIPSSVDGD